MATYNGEKYLHEQVDSILGQTIQDFELVICDDCSSDKTLSILREFERADDRIRVYANEHNLGFKDNFGKAISLCETEYIALADQDDIWYPDHLELLINNIGDSSLAVGDTYLIDADGKEMGITGWKQESNVNIPTSNQGKAMSFLLYRSHYLGNAMLFKKELAERALPIPANLPYHDAWLYIVACFFGGVVCVNKPITKYRRTANSVTGMRTKKVHRLGMFFLGVIWENKLTTINNLLMRYPDLCSDDIAFLNKMRNICQRNSTIIGKIKNFFFKLRYFRTIYNADFTHWR